MGKVPPLRSEALALGPRPTELDGWGLFLVGAVALAKGLSADLQRPSFPRQPAAAADSGAADSPTPKPLKPLLVSQLPSAPPEYLMSSLACAGRPIII